MRESNGDAGGFKVISPFFKGRCKGDLNPPPALLFQRREKKFPLFQPPLHPLLSGGEKRGGGKGDFNYF